MTETLASKPAWTCPKCGKTFKQPGGHIGSCGTGRPERAFWEKVEKTDTCWLYRGFIKWDGYGWLCRGGRYMTAHRYSWILANGQPPEGLSIMHACDVPACCNPAHLRLGTHQDNMADQVSKLRHVYGERGGRNKLTREQVAIVRAEFKRIGRRTNAVELAKRYGVGRGTIENAVKGETWAIATPAPVLHPNRVRPVRKQT